MNIEQKEVIKLLQELEESSGSERIEKVAEYLGYEIGYDPVNPENEWKMLLHEDFNPGEQSVLAVMLDNELDEETPVRAVRKRHEQVIQLKDGLGTSYIVPLAAFVGNGRIILYRVGAGNRDERLDLSVESVRKVPLYAEHFNSRLKKENLRLKEDEFGFGYDIVGLDDLFKRSLSGRFQQMIELYRKKLSEAIAGSRVRFELEPLLTNDAKRLLVEKHLTELIEDPSFKSGLGCVVDTIILRQLLRRFLEGYYGIEAFNMSGIALGVGAGTLEEALQEAVQVYRPEYDDKKLQKALQKRGTITEQLSMDDMFAEEEIAVTTTITFKENGEEKIIEIYNNVREQFEVAYGGDLFAGSVAVAANKTEQALTETFPELMAKLWADTSTEQYSFRYEDLPPELLQQQYENSMSRTVQIQLQDDKPSVFYGDDRQEQKGKGAYYTDSRLVDYMVRQSVEPAFEERLQAVREALVEQDRKKAEQAIRYLLSLKVIDLTCGGGSFLRGAFYYLSERHQALSRLSIEVELADLFPVLKPGDDGQHEWEKHLLSNVLYGVDIDYKALIICSQTLTLSALRHWQIGEEFPELIGRTLIHQNALISPIPINERKKAFKSYRKDINQLIAFRKSSLIGDKEAKIKAEELRQKLQKVFKAEAYKSLGAAADMLFVESLEINVPEVFFNEDGTWNDNGGFDAAIGNPPWDIWGTNTEEFFEPYESKHRSANKQQKIIIEQTLYNQYPFLKTKWESTKRQYENGSKHFLDDNFYQFQRWKVNGRYTASHINLYKVAMERFYQVIKENGYLSILVPGNIANDQGATGLRHLFLENASLKELLSFENRKKIFAAVDSRFKIALVGIQKKRPTQDHIFKAFFYRHNLEELWNESAKLEYPIALTKQISPEIWSLLELRDQQEVDILNKLHDKKYPLLGEQKSYWDITWRSEFNMTTDSHLFKTYKEVQGNIPLFEGKTINQFENKGPIRYEVELNDIKINWFKREKKRIIHYAESYSGLIRSECIKSFWKSEEELNDFLKGPEEFYQLAYREVASGTNKRTLISTILPKNVTFGHTLVSIVPMKLTFTNGKPEYKYTVSLKEQLVLTGIFNSFTIDFILRRKVGTHVSIFYMYQLPIPNLSEDEYYFNEIVTRAAHLICTSSVYDELAKEAGMSGYEEGVTDPELRQLLQNQIDAFVAQLYGLSRNELIYILSTFESPKHKTEMRRIGQGVIEAFDELTEKGALPWPILSEKK